MATMTMTAPMKAVLIHHFGGADALQFEEVPRPEPRRGEVLIRVRAAGVNPVDWKIREGGFGNGPLPQVMGSDVSGEVAAVGPQVTEYKLGDPVFGSVSEDSGGYAEYALAPVEQIARKPMDLDHTVAAALPVASLTAWQALFDMGNVEAGQLVLIHAASGGVGNLAVQFAKWKDAHVIGTTSVRNLNFVRDLGADEVLDYKAVQFEDIVHDIDMVLDSIGGDTQERSMKVLKKGGVLVSIVQPPDEKKAAHYGIRALLLRSRSRGDQLARIADLVVSGVVKVHLQSMLPLSEAAQAQELSQTGHARGKIVLTVD